MYSCIYFLAWKEFLDVRTRAIYAAGLHQTQHMHARIGGATEHELARFWKRPGGGHMTRHARTQDRRAGHGWPLMTRPRVHTRRRAGSPARPRPPRGAAESRARGEGAGRREV